MSKVFVLDTNKQPLDPVHPGHARLLLKRGRAAVWRRFPFTIILNCAVTSPHVEPLRIKLDPGSKTTGIAVLNDASGEAGLCRRTGASRAQDFRRCCDETNDPTITSPTQNPVQAASFRQSEKQAAGLAASFAPESHQQCADLDATLVWALLYHRTKPRTGKVRYAADGPSRDQWGRVSTGYASFRAMKYASICWRNGDGTVPIAERAMSRLRLSTSPREPASRDDRVCNLTLACHRCNEKKGVQDIRDFLTHTPDLLQQILAQARAPHKDAAAINVTRWALYRRLQALGLPVECGSGGLTKYNRTLRGLPKAHWIDAACVGHSTPERLNVAAVSPFVITAQGHGCRQVTNVDRFGFPRGKPKQRGRSSGFKTGDLVRAVVLSGKKAGTYTGRVLVRASGSFDIRTQAGRVQGINGRYCHPLHRSDG
jgi:RRXRR protein